MTFSDEGVCVCVVRVIRKTFVEDEVESELRDNVGIEKNTIGICTQTDRTIEGNEIGDFSLEIIEKIGGRGGRKSVPLVPGDQAKDVFDVEVERE